MRIAIDGMGGDHAPDEIVSGVIDAALQIPDAKILLVGQRDRVSRPNLPKNVEVIHASEIVGMDEEPAKALRGKPDSSLRNSLRLVKRGEADAVISAGNTGALVGGAIVPVFGLGNLEGVKRPGIAIPMPVDGGFCAVIDAGANPNPKPVHLVQYAAMGAVYAKYLNPKIKIPRVGILNIGEEANKGTELQRDVYAALEKSRFNFEFVGNIEPAPMFLGKADVVVSDGFAGNLVLKMAEGFREYLIRNLPPGETGLKEKIQQSTAHDSLEQGGAPVLGVRGIVIKCHGGAKARTISNAIKLTATFIKDKMNDHIVEELKKLSRSTAWFSKWFGKDEE
ncbi:MAG TPA: phosphate acyltransferase PlsX [Planctomycetota bacterium]|nr:phosphate acyltransferase PlsX [Planctomycetota bacterium]